MAQPLQLTVVISGEQNHSLELALVCSPGSVLFFIACQDKLNYDLVGSWNHRIVGVRKDLRAHLVLSPPWAWTPSTRPGCSKLHPP